jgi:putative MATE family efflux protein
MMGHFSDGGLELGALAVAGMYIWILNTFLWPLSNGVQAIITRRLGAGGERGKLENLGSVLDHGIITSLLFAAIAFILSFLAGPLFRTILHDDKLIELGLDYIRILRWSFIPLGIQQIFQAFFSSIHKPRYSMMASIITNCLNIILNYIFIYGKFGLPEMGIKGAALGSLISYWLGLFFILSVALKKEHISKYKFFHCRKIDPEIVKNIIRISMPPAIQNILAMLIMLFYEAMVENLGAVYLAATHIVLSFYRINKTVVGGFSHGAAILIGNELGANNKAAAKKVMQAGYLIGAIVGLIVFALVFLFPEKVASIFSRPGETLDTAALALRFFAPFFFFEILGFTFEMVFTGNGWGKFVLFSEFTTNVIFILAFTFITTRLLGMGISSAWWGFALYQLGHSLLLHLGYKSEKWIHARVD